MTDRITLIDDLISYLRTDLIETENEIDKLVKEKEVYKKLINELMEMK